ncbi:ASCH domain-containing protein [Pseudovibrio exalbescens]|uniref:ASCH domain-containing protein n=1 Tax=Pseudovibrio exalbescens TaxID=197461 RepID=UPI0023662C8A|nr:ASCH domain-containing protein [Pseudovibrio exalbescens]MDD7910544.1 ASCH domain-containing protein [Pseudovibrio exalbescens]
MTSVPSDLPSFSFGDTPELADELLKLVLIGQKTATCGDLQYYESEGLPIPKAGEQYLVLDGAGQPGCVIELIDVSIRRFDEIDEVWAVLEGEGDLSLEHWQVGHKRYFERLGVYAPDMKLVCEYFRLVKIFKKSGQDTVN